jgi:hypothetical protein
MIAADDKKTQRTFKIEPPMHGNAFRVLTNKDHKAGS